MKKEKPTYADIDDYIHDFPPDVRKKLIQIRDLIKKTAPEAEGKISYQMPAFFLHGVLVYFAAFKDHISFFPTASGIAAFKSEIQTYKNAKGTVQFPLDKPIPLQLIKRIVAYRVKQNKNKLKESVSGSAKGSHR